jgi:hypothetical protein
VTIAIGFLHQDGVLLCADTQVESWLATTHENKLACFDCPAGAVALAFAGNAEFALSAIEKCARKLKRLSNSDNLTHVIESTLEDEYRRVVFGHPDRRDDPLPLDYSFLIAVRPTGGQVELFRTHEIVMHSIPRGYSCIGTGEPLADYLLSTMGCHGLPERQTLRIAAFIVALAKGKVPGCGGDTLCLSVRADGTIGEFYGDREIEQIERTAGGYFLKAQQLFFAHLDDYENETDFKGNVSLFDDYAFELRSEWRKILERYRPRPVGQPLPQSTTHDL